MSLESSGRGHRRRLLKDPQALRALAHPIRLELQSIVGRAGRVTTADAARQVGISHGLASHHLRQLAKYGFVEQVAGADNRERPWRLVTTSTDIEGIEEHPDGSAALAVFEQVVAERAIEDLIGWQARRGSWSPAWRSSSGVGSSSVYLTEAELAELTGAFEALLMRYIAERPIDDVESRPPGSRAVGFTLIVTPQDPTAGEG
jgi:DNA-binding transcriptional ArsR family regulator